jgi:pimeloyl-ACP methyl ester carboxylesterase
MFIRNAGCWLALAGFLALVPQARAEDRIKAGTVRAADGLTIAYDVRGQGDTALVFLHGWCGDRDSWKHQLNAFARDYQVVAIDLGGHGASGKDRKAWTVLGLAGDVEAVIKALQLKRVILVGHSMGGWIALEVARRLPGTVVAVIGADTLHNAEYRWSEEQMKQLLAGFEADFQGTLLAGWRGLVPANIDPELYKAITAKAGAQDKRMAIALFADFPHLDLPALFKNARVPIRAINADPGGFQYGQPTTTEVNKKYADFQAVQMEGVGHFPMLEKPAEFNAKLSEVLKEFAAKK